MGSYKGRSKRRVHKNRKYDTGTHTAYMAHKLCETCGKQCYLSRDEAKHSARVNHPGQVMHEYECEEPSGKVWWHLSSIPADKLSRLREQEHRQ